MAAAISNIEVYDIINVNYARANLSGARYVVLDVDFDDHRVIREGKEVVMPMLAQVFIEHKGHRVAVGSGWSQEQRIKYHKNPKDIIGKTITVQYFEETKNQEGGISLRFPTVKHVYENGRQC